MTTVQKTMLYIGPYANFLDSGGQNMVINSPTFWSDGDGAVPNYANYQTVTVTDGNNNFQYDEGGIPTPSGHPQPDDTLEYTDEAGRTITSDIRVVINLYAEFYYEDASGNWGKHSEGIVTILQTHANDMLMIDADEHPHMQNDLILDQPVNSLPLGSRFAITFDNTVISGPSIAPAQNPYLYPGPTGSICFASGTEILTDQGAAPIESLRAGDLVETLDHGMQPIRWIGHTVVTASELEANPKLRPIRIKAGALGPNLPEKDLVVSRQHRVLVRSKIAERMFGSAEVLIAACKLLDVEGISVADDITEVEYWHMLFDTHEVVWSNGAPAESLFTGPEALKAVSPEARAEIITLFPNIFEPDFHAQSARPIPQKGSQAKALALRHSKNLQPLIGSL